MEDHICANPEKYLEEPGLKLISRQHRIGGYIFDLLFEDRHGAKLIVELQKGTLDRVHTYKIMDYYNEYKQRHPEEFVELMVIANVVPRERRERLDSHGITWKEISVKHFMTELPIVEGSSADAMDDGVVADKRTSKLDEVTFTVENSRQHFWSMFLKLVKEKTNEFDQTNPTRKHYIGPTKNKLQYLAVSKDYESWVEICIQQSDESKDIYQGLFEDKNRIEEMLGAKLRWVNDPDKKRCKIMSQPIALGFKDQSKWEVVIDHLAQEISKLIRTVEALR